MSDLFTGKAISKSVSMPEDMWAYFERRRTDYGIPVSYQIQTILENAIKSASAPAGAERPEFPVYCDAQGREHAEY